MTKQSEGPEICILSVVTKILQISSQSLTYNSLLFLLFKDFDILFREAFCLTPIKKKLVVIFNFLQEYSEIVILQLSHFLLLILDSVLNISCNSKYFIFNLIIL